MAGIEDLFSGFGAGFGGMAGISGMVLVILIVLIAASIIGAIVFLIYRWKMWNLKVEFKIPRGLNDLKEGEEIDPDEITGFIQAEWGKGCFNRKQGVCFVKRKWISKSPIKPFDIKRFVQGNNILTVIQTGVDSYVPVLPESFLQMEDDNTGAQAALLRIKGDTSESKSWRNAFERDSKAAYSIINLLKEYAPFIAIGLVIFLWGLQFMILYTKIA